MSSGYKGLDDILTALRNTSVLGLPSGEYLMCFYPIYFFKLNGTTLLIALSLAEVHTCFLLLLSLPIAAMCFHQCASSWMQLLVLEHHHQPSSESRGRNK